MSTKDEQQVKPFAAVLQEIGKGQAHARLSESLAELVRAVTDTDKKGTLTLTLTVEPLKGGEALVVSTNHTVKLPQESVSSTFYATDEGQLTKNDPRQIQMPIRGVATFGESA